MPTANRFRVGQTARSARVLQDPLLEFRRMLFRSGRSAGAESGRVEIPGCRRQTDLEWGRPPGLRGSSRTRCWSLDVCSSDQAGVRELNLGELKFLDADGKPI